jgi:hypothetical protein
MVVTKSLPPKYLAADETGFSPRSRDVGSAVFRYLDGVDISQARMVLFAPKYVPFRVFRIVFDFPNKKNFIY